MFLGPERFFRLVILVFRKKNHYAPEYDDLSPDDIVLWSSLQDYSIFPGERMVRYEM